MYLYLNSCSCSCSAKSWINQSKYIKYQLNNNLNGHNIVFLVLTIRQIGSTFPKTMKKDIESLEYESILLKLLDKMLIILINNANIILIW